MSCLFCKNFHAVEPAEHRKEREARTCQYSCGNKWDAYTTARYVKSHKQDLDGLCLFNPVPAKVSAHWMCAKFEDGFYHTWKIGQPEGRENIWDWAKETMQTYMAGGDWQDQERTRLREENEQLKHAVKAARQRSASRLVRLNKLAKKEPPKPTPLRLVAAE